jgi:hypothetical protein
MSLDLHNLPAWPQSQESVTDQLASLVLIANRLGLYDAADAVKQMSGNIPPLKYGCHVDLEPHQEPDGCVIDDGNFHNCVYAKPGMRKEQCKYWRIVSPSQQEANQ